MSLCLFGFFCGCHVLSLASDLFFHFIFRPQILMSPCFVVLPHVNEETRF